MIRDSNSQEFVTSNSKHLENTAEKLQDGDTDDKITYLLINKDKIADEVIKQLELKEFEFEILEDKNMMESNQKKSLKRPLPYEDSKSNKHLSKKSIKDDLYFSSFVSKNGRTTGQKNIQKINHFTFSYSRSSKKEIKLDLSLYIEIDLQRIVKYVELKYPIRFKKIYYFLDPNYIVADNSFSIYLKDKINEQKLIEFLVRFIFNQNLRQRILSDLETTKKEEFKFSDYSSGNIEKEYIVLKFNLILKDYFKEICIIQTRKIKINSLKYACGFYHSSFITLIKKLKCFYNTLFKSKENLILLEILPEIELFYPSKSNVHILKKHFYKYIAFLSVIIFKWQFIKDNFKYIFKRHENEEIFSILNNVFFQFFLFEMRCFTSFNAFLFLENTSLIKYILYKTFVDFLNLLDIKLFNNLVLEKHLSLTNFMCNPELQKITVSINYLDAEKNVRIYELNLFDKNQYNEALDVKNTKNIKEVLKTHIFKRKNYFKQCDSLELKNDVLLSKRIRDILYENESKKKG